MLIPLNITSLVDGVVVMRIRRMFLVCLGISAIGEGEG